MSSQSRKSLLGHPAVVDTGCHCRSSKLSAFFKWSSAQKQRLNRTPISYTTSPTTSTSQSNFSHDAATTHPFSPSDYSPSPWPTRSPSPMNIPENSLRKKKQGITKRRGKMETTGAVEESVEVVMESWNPCVDFRESMMRMIVEKEIYAWDDLRELLRRFLSLNSPYHHLHILRAFSEALNEVFSPSAFAGESSGQRPDRKQTGGCEEEDHKEEERGGRVIKTSLSL
ncbi:hypothetical protein KSP39_PZI005778 [Platanthera zijinensis]|uniref:Transcription repressor n=1 Tax=Platanthera zijinensis TaxID=2320716 RepID=A0AAP0GB80_9ASPA